MELNLITNVHIHVINKNDRFVGIPTVQTPPQMGETP